MRPRSGRCRRRWPVTGMHIRQILFPFLTQQQGVEFLFGSPAAVHQLFQIAGVVADVEAGPVGGDQAQGDGAGRGEQAPGPFRTILLDPEIGSPSHSNR